MTSEFHHTPGWLAEETEQLRPRVAEMLAERQRAAALDAIHGVSWARCVDGRGDL
jgi:hypothetical protein